MPSSELPTATDSKDAFAVDRARIRKAALAILLWIWAVGTGARAYRGEPFSRAAMVAGVLALGGFLAWWTYHLMSRRNDGLYVMFPVLCAKPLNDGRLTVIHEVQICVVGAIVVIACSTAFGAMMRPAPSKLSPPQGRLWDSDVDGSPDL